MVLEGDTALPVSVEDAAFALGQVAHGVAQVDAGLEVVDKGDPALLVVPAQAVDDGHTRGQRGDDVRKVRVKTADDGLLVERVVVAVALLVVVGEVARLPTDRLGVVHADAPAVEAQLAELVGRVDDVAQQLGLEKRIAQKLERAVPAEDAAGEAVATTKEAGVEQLPVVARRHDQADGGLATIGKQGINAHGELRFLGKMTAEAGSTSGDELGRITKNRPFVNGKGLFLQFLAGV